MYPHATFYGLFRIASEPPHRWQQKLPHFRAKVGEFFGFLGGFFAKHRDFFCRTALPRFGTWGNRGKSRVIGTHL